MLFFFEQYIEYIENGTLKLIFKFFETSFFFFKFDCLLCWVAIALTPSATTPFVFHFLLFQLE